MRIMGLGRPSGAKKLQIVATRQGKSFMALFVASLVGMAIVAAPMATAQGPFPSFSRFCGPGNGGGECASPRSIAVDPANGHYFTVDELNRRVQEFTSWGEFIKSWGWGVVASGPGNKPRNEVQQISVNATGGTFILRYGDPTGFTVTQTVPIAFNATPTEVQTALETAPSSGRDRFAPGDLNVTGPAGGPWSVEFVGQYVDSDFGGTNFVLYASSSGLTGGTASASLQTVQNGGNFEICIPANGDVCRSGSGGSAPGQFGATLDVEGEGPQGIAVDGSGDIYVVDYINHRVQKFGPDGRFLLMFGGDVNVTDGSDVCTASDLEAGDVCGAGSFGNPGPGEGQFGTWMSGGLPYRGDFIDIGLSGVIYVGDTGRIQKFNSDGTFAGQISGGVLTGETVMSLAADAGGDLYVTFVVNGDAKSDVRRLNQAGSLVDSLPVGKPRALAAGPGGTLFVLDANQPFSSEVLEFNENGDQVDLDPESSKLGFASSELNLPTGLAVNAPPTCGLLGPAVAVANSNFSLSNTTNNFIGIYGSAPDPAECPPPALPPVVADQFASSVDASTAVVKARINPRFWADTRYYVEFGTERCSAGGCDRTQPAPPGSILTNAVLSDDVLTAGVFLTDLQPGTTYWYRFVAASGGGGPISGAERSFRTEPIGESPSACPNAAFRTGPGARLPDCRAYELVSPVDKEGGDVARAIEGFAGFGQASIDGGRVTYSSLRAFAEPDGAPISNQYLSSRSSAGWSTKAISPPRGVPLLNGPTDGLPSLFRAFSADLCQAWVNTDTDIALSPGSPPGVPNLYRRDNCGAGAFDLITTTPPPGFGPIPYQTYYSPAPQGFSADGSTTVFRANAALAVADGDPKPPLICSGVSESATLSYQWLRDGAPIAGALGPSYTPDVADQGHSIQCQVTAALASGKGVMTSETSLVSPGPTPAPPSPGYGPFARANLAQTELPGMPSISGIAEPGGALTCTPGPWIGAPTFTFQWFRNAEPIAGATSGSYTPVAADRGATLQCRAIGSNASGTAVADSLGVPVKPSTPRASAAPSVSGTASVGEGLTCDPGTWTGAPTFTFQWLRNGANIAGASASTYTLVAADAGKSIQCRVVATTPDAALAAASAGTVVAPPPGTAPPVSNDPVTVSGDGVIGEELSCDPGTWSGSPTSFAYRWLRNGANINLATNSTYTVVAADLGKAVQCQVVATNSGGANMAINATDTGVQFVASATPDISVSSRGPARLYVTDGTNLRLVNVLPDGTTTTANAWAGSAWSGILDGVLIRNELAHAVSADGSRVFWTSVPFAGSSSNTSGTGALYVRLNATQEQSAVAAGQCTEPAKACSLEISANPGTRYVAADAQGTRVLYTVENGDIRELREARIVDSGGVGSVESNQIVAQVSGVMGAGADLSRVYFISPEVLPGSDPNSEGDTAQANANNLYRYDQGVGFEFVATLGGLESRRGSDGGPPSVIAPPPFRRAAQVSEDGESAAFIATTQLTDFDNSEVQSGIPTAEVFVYRATANGGEGQLFCASCKPNGARPRGELLDAGNLGAEDDLWAAATLPTWGSPFQPTRALAESGQRLFFDSYDALVPGDVNGKADVYQWELPGEGSCTEASSRYSEINGGCVELISSGGGGDDSEFLDASADGADVFFVTQSDLVDGDRGKRDVYDARINGGFEGPPPPPVPCEPSACQQPGLPPSVPLPSSERFDGPGNPKPVKPKPKPKRCARGKHKVKKGGKVSCVKNGGKKGSRNRGGKSR